MSTASTQVVQALTWDVLKGLHKLEDSLQLIE